MPLLQFKSWPGKGSENCANVNQTDVVAHAELLPGCFGRLR